MAEDMFTKGVLLKWLADVPDDSNIALEFDPTNWGMYF